MDIDKVIEGKARFRWGEYEARQSFNWRTLAIALVVGIATWVLDVAIAIQGGEVPTTRRAWIALGAGLVVVIARVILEWARNNVGKRLPNE